MQDSIPEFRHGESPPAVLGTAALTTLAFAGKSIDELDARIASVPDQAAWAYDQAILRQLAFRRDEALALQETALRGQQIFRVARGPAGPRTLRLLAIMAPGDLMVNAPLDFICAHLDVQLDFLYLVPGTRLPAVVPEHDLAFFAVSEADDALRARLTNLFDAWPRPALNDPRHLPLFARDAFARALAGIPAIQAPATRQATRAEAAATLSFPALIRPVGSHAGAGLAKLDGSGDVATYLAGCDAQMFYLSDFIDYRGAGGQFRKYRIVFIDRAPYLCHMAISDHWMIHYLNAGMTENAAKRGEEAAAMADFDNGFARRHQAAFDALNDLIDLDYYSIDCAETAEGRLLVFEADTGAIIHMMDPPDLFPYKRPQMLRVFRAFGDLLMKRCLAETLAPA